MGALILVYIYFQNFKVNTSKMQGTIFVLIIKSPLHHY